ncbi:MAG: short-chain dehydrogenase [Novosphingobium sp.]|nr:short-chain dehydrogenase [Novosphingobium sp.]
MRQLDGLEGLNGKTVLVTGAAGGIGTLVTRQLQAGGTRVVGIDRVPSPQADDMILADLGTYDGIATLCEEIAFRPVDVLVNLAGIQYFGPLKDQPLDNLWTGYVINLIAPAMLSRAVLPGMKKRREGRIVNIGSVFGAIPFAHFASYSSAKAGLKGLSEALRRELAGTGIEVTHVAPRAVHTALNSDKVLAFAKLTKMNMDAPELVANRIVAAIAKGEKNVVIGFPESLFVRINALVPGVVDRALAGNDRKAAAMFNWA